MSDIFLKIISSTREFLPHQQLIDHSINLLSQAFPNADEIYFSVDDDIQFVDAGANWGRIICPNCGKEIDVAWWREAMGKAYASRFLDLDVIVPCCETKSSLALLKYEWLVGFARFVLNIRNPKNVMDEQTRKSLENILGTAILLIWALY